MNHVSYIQFRVQASERENEKNIIFIICLKNKPTIRKKDYFAFKIGKIKFYPIVECLKAKNVRK